MQVIRTNPEAMSQWLAHLRLLDEAKDDINRPIRVNGQETRGAMRSWDVTAPVLIVCPTRDRPDRFAQMCESALSTSTEAHIVAWVDEDQAALYESCRRDRVTILSGERVGPIAAVNRVVQLYRSPKVYGMVPDDAVFKSPGWDQYLLSEIAGFPNGVGVVAAAHNNSNFVNFPWLTRKWIDVLGWYYYPDNFHHCADTVVELLGDASHIVYAEPEKFYIDHAAEPTVNQDHWEVDVKRFLIWCVVERRLLVKRLREAIK